MAKENLEVPEKLNEQFMYNEMLKQVVAQKKSEFEAIQGKIIQYKTQLAALEEACRRTKIDSDSQIAQDKSKWQGEKNRKEQDWLRREELISRNEADMTRRIGALEERETQAEKIHEERNQLMIERLRYERLNREAEEKMNRATILNEEANNKLGGITHKEKEVESKLTQIKNELSIIENKRVELQEIESNIIKQKDNLEELRKEITPKVEEYNNLISKNTQLLAELKQKELEIAEKFDGDNRLFDVLQEKDKELKKKENYLNTIEEDLKRRELAINK